MSLNNVKNRMGNSKQNIYLNRILDLFILSVTLLN